MDFKLQGIITPLVTPFDAAGELNIAAVKPLVDYLIDRGIHGLFPAGTTGEGALLTLVERRQLAEAVVDAAAGRVPVIIHAGATTTCAAQELVHHAQAIGAQAAAIIPPFFYRHRDDALLTHYVTVANSAPDFPIYLYNFPAVSNNTLTFDLVMAMRAQAPNIIGMKDSSGSLELLNQLHTATNGQFNTANGGDGQILMAQALGFDASVSGNSNVAPELFVALYTAAHAGKLAEARLLQQKVNQVRQLLGDGSDLSLFKQMVARRGVDVGDVRAPLLAAAPAMVAERWAALQALAIF
ncbi:MAG: dihydrodipicolinate synthase family protein [Caldilineaceae bacterium]